ncbi:MAG: hypothetical protein KJZ69_10205 [Phycisphaerales bacterium]|nr:hypothetical protein [Phycisphaerales bacterium]
MLRRPGVLFGVACTLPLAGAAAASCASRPAGDVQLAVYSDVAEVAAGSTFHLAFEFTIEKHWHIYWLNAGDTGMPTEIEIKAPEGFSVGPVLFPGPRRLEDAGVMSFGYEGEATMIAEVKAPAALPPGSDWRFDVRADWLVCKQACLLGSAERSITLRTAAGEPTASPDSVRVAEARRRLPQPLNEFKIGRAAWTGTPAAARFEATVPGDFDLELFPLIVEGVESCPGLVEELPDGSRRLAWAFDVDVKRLGPAPPPTVGVLRVSRGDEQWWFDLVPEVGR